MRYRRVEGDLRGRTWVFEAWILRLCRRPERAIRRQTPELRSVIDLAEDVVREAWR